MQALGFAAATVAGGLLPNSLASRVRAKLPLSIHDYLRVDRPMTLEAGSYRYVDVVEGGHLTCRADVCIHTLCMSGGSVEFPDRKEVFIESSRCTAIVHDRGVSLWEPAGFPAD